MADTSPILTFQDFREFCQKIPDSGAGGLWTPLPDTGASLMSIDHGKIIALVRLIPRIFFTFNDDVCLVRRITTKGINNELAEFDEVFEGQYNYDEPFCYGEIDKPVTWRKDLELPDDDYAFFRRVLWEFTPDRAIEE